MSRLSELLDVVVLTLNEAANLRRCLAAVPLGVARWVIDSGSSDGTQDLARELGCSVVEHRWAGFAEQRNFALRACGSQPWVLFIDADEEYPPEAFAELQAILPHATFDALMVPSRLVWRRRTLNHAPGYPVLHPRVIRRGSAQFVRVRGHAEAVVSSRPVSQLSSEYLHHIYDGDAGAWLNKHLRLAIEEAEAPSTSPDVRTVRDAMSRRAGKGVLRVPMRFLFHLALSKGFLDGSRGLEYSFFYSWYELTKVLARPRAARKGGR